MSSAGFERENGVASQANLRKLYGPHTTDAKSLQAASTRFRLRTALEAGSSDESLTIGNTAEFNEKNAPDPRVKPKVVKPMHSNGKNITAKARHEEAVNERERKVESELIQEFAMYAGWRPHEAREFIFYDGELDFDRVQNFVASLYFFRLNYINFSLCVDPENPDGYGYISLNEQLYVFPGTASLVDDQEAQNVLRLLKGLRDLKKRSTT